jgi:hypothetical protein
LADYGRSEQPERTMSAKRMRLPSRLPAGAKYVLECRGRMQGHILVDRHVEMPDGSRVELVARLVPTCCAEAAASKPARPRSAKSTRAKVLI